MAKNVFGEYYSNEYERVRSADKLTKGVALSEAAGAELGHPDYNQLLVGDTAEGQGTILFLDIRGFTKMSMALSNRELVDILQAMTVASVRAVYHFGGHVIEFTGDGVMATFGDFNGSPEVAASAALQTTASLLAGVRDYVNPRLEQLGKEPIRTAIGMEFGKLLWSRIGIGATTQVKPISDVTFLAGKISSKFTNAWESKVGPGLAQWIPAGFKDNAGKYEFTLNKKAFSRELFLFKWEEFANALEREPNLLKSLVEKKLSTATIAAAKVLTPAAVSQSKPQKLKDQPFF